MFAPTFRPLLVIVVALVFLTCASLARASPRRAWSSQEDALADGDIDPEDVATAQALKSARRPLLETATSGRPILGQPILGSTYLSLVGFSRRTMDDQREVGGFVVLGFPFDRVARGSTRLLPTLPSPTLDLERTAGAGAATTATTTGDGPVDLALTPRLARSAVTAAWRASNLPIDDARLDSIVSRARWSAVLPETRLRAVRFEDARLSLDTGTDTSRLRDSAGANVGFEARVTWRFDRLIYADDEPAFERIRLELRDARTRVASKVLEALFHWQRALLDFKTLPPHQQGTRDEADVLLRMMEAEAALDVLTSGWFSAQKKSFSKGLVRGGGSVGGGGPKEGDL